MILRKAKKLLAFAIVGGGLVLLANPALALDRAAAQKVVKEKGDAVVTLEVVLEEKYSYGGQQNERENKQETIGVVLDETGLVVTALSNIDPGQVFSKFTESEDSYTTSLKSLKYILTDGTEIEAGVVVRDPDLGLIFLRPIEKPATKLTFLPTEDVPRPTVLDEIFSVERSGRITRRVVMAKSGEIMAVVDRPRLFYVPNETLVTNHPGAPVFTADGKLLGLTTLYAFPGGRKTMGDNDKPYIEVIRPVADIISIAKEAPDKVVETPAPSSADGETSGTKEVKPGT